MTQIEINTEGTMHEIADFIKSKCGEKYGFMVLITSFGESEVANYISNINREDMISVLREKADVLEQNRDIKTRNGSRVV